MRVMGLVIEFIAINNIHVDTRRSLITSNAQLESSFKTKNISISPNDEKPRQTLTPRYCDEDTT